MFCNPMSQVQRTEIDLNPKNRINTHRHTLCHFCEEFLNTLL